MYTGAPVIIERAAEWGLVNDMVPVEPFTGYVTECKEGLTAFAKRANPLSPERTKEAT